MRSPLAILCGLLAVAAPPTRGRADVLTIQPAASYAQVEAASGVWLDLIAPIGSVFIPFTPQSGGGVGGSTDGLRAPLGGRLLVSDSLDQSTPFFQIHAAHSQVVPTTSGNWAPGLPGDPGTPAAASIGVFFGSFLSLARGMAALRGVAFDTEASQPADALGNQRWAWPAPPFDGPLAHRIEFAPIDGFADLLVTLAPDVRMPLSEVVKVPLVLSADRRATIERSPGGGLRIILPIVVDHDLPATARHTALPVRVHLALSGRIVAQNATFVPEPDAATARAAAFAVLGLVAAHRRRSLA